MNECGDEFSGYQGLYDTLAKDKRDTLFVSVESFWL